MCFFGGVNCETIISVDSVKNRIYYTVFGFCRSPDEVPTLLQDWKQTLARVEKGFTVYADLSQCRPALQAMKPLFEHVQRMLIAAGLKKSSELPGESATVELGANALAKQTGINKQSFRNRQKAEVWLDKNE